MRSAPPPSPSPTCYIPWFPFPEVCGNYPTCGGNRILMLISPMSSPPFSLSHSLSFFYLQHFIYFFIFHLYQSFCIQKVHFSYDLTFLKTFPFSVSRIYLWYLWCFFLLWSSHLLSYFLHLSLLFSSIWRSGGMYAYCFIFIWVSLSFSLTVHLSLSLTIHR